MLPFASFLAIVGLALVHLFAAEVPWLRQGNGGAGRAALLSAAGGVPVAYVFLQLLPALAGDQAAVARAMAGPLSVFKNPLYLVALLGLAAFYGVQRAVQASRQRRQAAGMSVPTSRGVFWLSIATFSAVSAIIGYLLVQQERNMRDILLFVLAMALKFTVDDSGLHWDHEQAYDRVGRWVVVAALCLGWGVGLAGAVPVVVLALLRAFLAGGILLNVLKEELAPSRAGGFGWFVLGAAAYAALLLVA